MEHLTPEKESPANSKIAVHKREISEVDVDLTEPAAKYAKSTDSALVTKKQLDSEKREAERLRRLQEKEAEMELKKEAKEQERRKKEAERLAEKERKEAEKLQQKLQKEAEKRAEKERKEAEKEAEKQRKEAEKEAEKQRKEAEKQRKEAEKQAEKERKEAERLKAQPRINLFFKADKSHVIHNHGSRETDENLSDFKKTILPFQPRAGGRRFDSVCNAAVSPEEATMNPMEWLATRAARPLQERKLTSQSFQMKLALAHESTQIEELLRHLRIRRIQFSHLSSKYLEGPSSLVKINEEYRPPYVGSTRDLSEQDFQRLCIDPFNTDFDSHLNYDYDSEVEWDAEDEEGEELGEDDLEDSDEDLGAGGADQDELREFLSSDEDGNSSQRHKLMGPLTPVVLWNSDELSKFAVQLLGNLTVIDPHEFAAFTGNSSAVKPPASLGDILDPVCAKIGGADELKAALLEHRHSTGTKTLILELLKQRFPKATASEIRQVLDASLERQVFTPEDAPKRKQKRWVFTPKAAEYFAIDSAQQ